MRWTLGQIAEIGFVAVKSAVTLQGEPLLKVVVQFSLDDIAQFCCRFFGATFERKQALTNYEIDP